MIDLDQLGAATVAATQQGSVMPLRMPTGEREVIPGAWIRVRSDKSPECKAALKKHRRTTAHLIAKGDQEEAIDPARTDAVATDTLVAAFIEASPLVRYRGQPITADNIRDAVTDPNMADLLRDPMIAWIGNPANFPGALPAQTPAAVTTASASSPPSAPTSAAASN